MKDKLELPDIDMNKEAGEVVNKLMQQSAELITEYQDRTANDSELLRRLISVVAHLCSAVGMLQTAAMPDVTYEDKEELGTGADTLLEDDEVPPSTETW